LEDAREAEQRCQASLSTRCLLGNRQGSIGEGPPPSYLDELAFRCHHRTSPDCCRRQKTADDLPAEWVHEEIVVPS